MRPALANTEQKRGQTSILEYSTTRGTPTGRARNNGAGIIPVLRSDPDFDRPARVGAE